MRVAAALAVLLLPLPVSAAPPAPLPAAEPLALALEAPGSLTIGVPAEVPFLLRSSGLGGTGHAPPAARAVNLSAALDGPELATPVPEPIVLEAGALEARGVVRLTPQVLGTRALAMEAHGATVPGEAAGNATFVVVKDTLAVEGLAAGVPDADLDLPLRASLRSGQLAAEPLSWSLEAEHRPRNGTGTLRWVAAQGEALASPSALPWTAVVRARYGPGSYAFTLVAGGPRLERAEAVVHAEVPEVAKDSASAPFTLVIPDAPTTLRLASDAVNADGKAKAPGSALLTRVLVADANGLADVRRVVFSYARDDGGVLVPVEAHVHEGPWQGTEAPLEDRFDTAPMKDGSYVATIVAEGTGAPRAQRTFAITDASPEADLVLARASVQPDRAVRLEGTLRVSDANLGTGPLDPTDVRALGVLQLVLYKGSARVAEAGWALDTHQGQGPAPRPLDLRGEGTRSTPFPYQVVGSKGQLTLPVAVVVPEGAASGTYRLSVAGSQTLGSTSFDVLPLPRITRLALTEALPGAQAEVEVEVAPAPGLVAVELRAPWGAVLRAAVEELAASEGVLRWTPRLALPLPLDDDHPLSLLAVADLGEGRVVLSPAGAPVNARTAPVRVANAPPSLEAHLRLGSVPVGDEAWVHPHAAAELTLHARASDPNGLEPDLADEVLPLEVEARDWRGQPAPFAWKGDAGPASASWDVASQGAKPGRYALAVRARDDDGATAERVLRVQVGTHFRLALASPAELAFAPSPSGELEAELVVHNRGNAPAAGLVVLAEGLPPGLAGTATLALPNGTLLGAPLEEGFARFEGPLLAPGEAAGVRLALRADGLAAGTHAGRILVAGEAA